MNRSDFLELLASKVEDVIGEPEHNWTNDFRPYMSDDQGKPVVRVAVTADFTKFDQSFQCYAISYFGETDHIIGAQATLAGYMLV